MVKMDQQDDNLLRQLVSQQCTSEHAYCKTAPTETESSSELATKENILYKLDSHRLFLDVEYQCKCIHELYDRIFSEGSPPNVDELMRLLYALSLQAPNFQPPLPPDFIPIIRFDAEKVPYFEFHFFTRSLPLFSPLTGEDVLLNAVNDDIRKYSASIFQCMMKAQNHLGTVQSNSTIKQNFQTNSNVQESENSSGKLKSTFLHFRN